MAPTSAVATLVGAFVLASAAPATTQFRDDFSSPSLDRGRWVVTSEGDFKESRVEVTADHRLRLRADTIGTRDETVKFLGARTRDAFALLGGLCVAATLDWNEQRNGSYLSAALILSGAETLGNPLTGDDWLAAEYIGVPPGRNARLQLSSSTSGRRELREDDGWPGAQREGRRIGKVRIVLFVSPTSTRMWENGRLRHQSSGPGFAVERAFVHVQMSSHSNYPAREVYFDDVEVNRGGAAACEQKARGGR